MKLEEINPFEDVREAFLYIPDISGFTKFINHTNIHVSKHIIKVLLEAILDSNILNLKVAEIQGDAIVFYSLGVPPTISKLEAQVQKTFLDFQKALLHLNAVTNSPDLQDLTLKIIVHYGLVSTTEIKGIPKLLGSDIILAHRILKNNIKEDEYLLMTEKYLQTQPKEFLEQSFLWSEIKEGKKYYEYFGPVDYQYVLLTPLKSSLFLKLKTEN